MKKKNVNVSKLVLILSFVFITLFSNSALYSQSYLSSILKIFNGAKSGVKASFSFSPIIVVTGIPVKFMDKSSGNPNYWLWDFGDGNVSYEQNPAHIYDKGGIYTVSLTVKLDSASSTTNKKIRVYASKATTSTSTKALELTPSFEFSPLTPEVGMTVQFTDSSTGNPTSWQWDFGDGSQSTQQNPQHQYQSAGTFNVTLTISNGTSSKSLTKSINVLPMLSPGFNYSPAITEAGENIQFTDTSTGNPTSWSWNFGDGATSSAQNPSHAYSSGGTYTVTLQVSNGTYTKSTSKSITVLAPITVDFTFSPSTPAVNQDVVFANQTSGSVDSYLWNFGDGSTSTAKDPTHKFTSAGSFTVTLTATNARGSKTKSKTLVVSQSLSASFAYSPSSPYAGQTVQFTDTSTGSPTSWQWDFGDGSSSTLQNPSHAYSNSGTYTVTLKVTNSTDSKTASNTITIKPAVQADFTFSPTNPNVGATVQFTDKSTGNITSWSWKFGDGATSTQQNPAHAYSVAGSYNVTLTVSDGTTSNSMTQTITVKANIVADFTYSPSSPVVGQEVQFLDNSQGSPTSWSWDFGDGTSSTVKNPTHTYSQAGTFSVKLTVSDGVNSNTTTKSVSVTSSSTRVIAAASPALADVQAAISQANPGDTVIVPNGSAVWTQPLLITKGIILKAETKGGVTITANFKGTDDADNNFMIVYNPSNPAANEPFRLSGFVLDAGNLCEGIKLELSTTDVINKVRIDNNVLRNLGTGYNAAAFHLHGAIYGVADNNVFYLNNDIDTNYRGLGFYDYYPGKYAWEHRTYEHGTADHLYFEDNTFYIRNLMVASGIGGRYAFRHNHIIMDAPPNHRQLYLLDAHGNMGTGGNWGTMGVEFSENDIDLNYNGITFIDLRGGKGLVYNNRVTNVVWTPAYQVREEYNDNLNPPANNLITGQPQHVSETYFFNQTNNGSKIYPALAISETIDYGGNEGIVPREDVHVFVEKSNFDGSSGVGVGLLSQRPASCTTEGVAWWATDENKLYRWHNGKWELYYTPYTYPHPLRTILGD
jgi:PKD repeat protein